jgi:hypothetical protein
MTAYIGNPDYFGLIGRKCAMCGEKIEHCHSAVRHDFYGEEDNPYSLVLCEYCAPVLIARIANDLLTMSGGHNLQCIGETGVKHRGFTYLYNKNKIQFSNGHRSYLEKFMGLVTRYNTQPKETK